MSERFSLELIALYVWGTELAREYSEGAALMRKAMNQF